MKKSIKILSLLLTFVMLMNIVVFIPTTVNAETQSNSILYGDVNGDGKVSIGDLTKLKSYFANYDYKTSTSTVNISDGADFNKDGSVTISDLTALKNYFANYDYSKVDSPVKKSVLCIGQSNMGGRGFLTGNLSGNPDYTNDTEFTPQVVSPISDDRIYMMNSTTSGWVTMQEPIFVDPGKYPGASLTASFAKAYVETFDETLGIIAVPNIGGKSLAKWAKGTDLYNTAVAMAKEAMKSSEIVAILWHQGEADTTNNNYEAELKAILDNIIKDVGLDKNKIAIITGELFETVSSDPSMTFTAGKGISKVNNALHAIDTEKYYPNYAVVSGKGIHCNPDHIHADGPSVRLLGYRFFAAYYKLKTGKTYSFTDNYSAYVETK